MNPPKQKATEEDALEILYAFLQPRDPPQHPSHFDSKELTKQLRDKSLSVSTELRKTLTALCEASRKTEEYRCAWLIWMGVDSPKTIRQNWVEFYEEIVKRVEERRLLNNK
jgi:hypothetical protein